jgi:HAD superfamily hydrolase (TIGR01509 family)
MYAKSITGVVLDIDGTTISLTKGVGEIYSELLLENGVVSDPSILERVARKIWGEFQPLYLNTAEEHQTTHERERSVWLAFVRQVLSEGGISSAENPAIIEMIYEAFSSARFRRIEPGVENFLRAAQSANIAVFAATNNDARSRAVLKAIGLEGFFRGTYVAGDLGWKKPSVHFYRGLEDATRREAHQLLHIGNDPHLDVEVARRCGWEAILYDPKGKGAAPRFGHFDELAALLLSGTSR